MKILIFMIFMFNLIYGQTFTVYENKWHMFGAKEDINTSKFNGSCSDIIWHYDLDSQTWKYYSSIISTTEYEKLSSITDGMGFWLYSGSDCNIDTSLITSINIDTTITIDKTSYAYKNPLIDETDYKALLSSLTEVDTKSTYESTTNYNARIEEYVSNADLIFAQKDVSSGYNADTKELKLGILLDVQYTSANLYFTIPNKDSVTESITSANGTYSQYSNSYYLMSMTPSDAMIYNGNVKILLGLKLIKNGNKILGSTLYGNGITATANLVYIKIYSGTKIFYENIDNF